MTLRSCPQLCENTNAPDGSDGEGWRALQVHDGVDALGTPIAQTGVVSKLSEPLAAKGIAIFYVGTFSCDFILVPEMQLKDALLAFQDKLTPHPSPSIGSTAPSVQQLSDLGEALDEALAGLGPD